MSSRNIDTEENSTVVLGCCVIDGRWSWGNVSRFVIQLHTITHLMVPVVNDTSKRIRMKFTEWGKKGKVSFSYKLLFLNFIFLFQEKQKRVHNKRMEVSRSGGEQMPLMVLVEQNPSFRSDFLMNELVGSPSSFSLSPPPPTEQLTGCRLWCNSGTLSTTTT